MEQRPHGFPQFEGFNAKVDFIFVVQTPQKMMALKKETREGCVTRKLKRMPGN